MLKIPGMLMVGAAGRGSGKTRFACSLIKKFGSQHNIIGIKVTPVQKANGICPRGESGCGVCSSLKGHFYITEETNSHAPLEVRTEGGVVPQGDLLLTGQANKDTCKMLAAGASRVFWLRVLRKHLEEGVVELLDVIGNDAVSVCESNSLRRVVEPGLFVMVKSCGAQSHKVSAKDAIRYADRIVLFDGNKFDIDADEIELVDGRWVCKMQATAIVMAGGGSARMGQDKSMLLIRGQPMIKYIVDRLRPHFSQILISSDNVSKYSFLGVEVIPDEIASQGPLGGIASALKASANELNFVIACDIPQVDIDLMKKLLREGKDFDAVVPRIGQSRYEPLFAVYKKDALAAIEAALLSGNNRIIDALSRCKVRYIDLTGAYWLKNLNTMEDYWEFVGKKNDAAIRKGF